MRHYATEKCTKRPQLSCRESEILSLIAQGMGTKQIASVLHLSTHTVANHRKNMLHKTGSGNMTQLLISSAEG